jgi:hypothetical protein
MHSVVALFSTRQAAEQAARSLDVKPDQVSVVAPAPREQEDAGIGPAIGGTVGGALGIAAGSQLGPVAASLLIPGVGPVVAIGIGAAILGAGGLATGIAAGKKLDEVAAPEPSHDPNDVFFYHEALRRGRAIVLVIVSSDQEEDRIWKQLASGGGESLDAAREVWWREMRDSERSAYRGDFARDERDYRRGFEAALRPENRGTFFNEPSEDEGTPAYREGFRRGHDYLHKLEAA